MTEMLPQRTDLNLPDAICLASGLFDDGHYEEAERLFRAAEQLGGGFAAINGIGLCLNEMEKPGEALPWFDRGYAILRDEMMALSANRAKALLELGRNDEALMMYEGLVRSSPQNYELRYMRGLAYLQLGRHEDAIADLDFTLERDPGNDKARFGRGFASLVLGDYANGFRDYECRLKDDIPDIDVPLWDGAQDISGKTVLVHGEMGLGDNIMFMRFVPLMVAKGAKVIVVVPDSQRFMVDAIPGAEFRSVDRSTWPALDYWVRFMSLAWCFRVVTVETVPAPVPLSYDKWSMDYWHEATRAPGKLRVGLCWSGSRKSRYDAHRTIPLKSLAPLFDLPGVQFFSLQKDIRDEDREAFDALPIVDLAPQLTTFSDTAHAMKNLDLVITVDTSVAHMAGTVGVPTFVMLTSFRTYWLWIQKLTTSPWYPSLRLFRQQTDGDWASVVDPIRNELVALSSVQRRAV